MSLADLVGYRAALSGKATADDARPSDPPARVGFRDLWERSDAYRGRRVTVRGRVARTFRQGPVGSFPPLLQVWTFSTAGDPFCLVFPPATPSMKPEGRGQTAPAEGRIPGPGRTVRFTGTFLKMVRYAAGDGDRLAPLIVGDRPPGPAPAEAGRWRPFREGWASIPAARVSIVGAGRRQAGMGLTLAVIAAGILARQHLREDPLRSRLAMRDRLPDPTSDDPPLQFIDHKDDALV